MPISKNTVRASFMTILLPLLIYGCSGSTTPTGTNDLPPQRLATSSYYWDEERGGIFVTGHDPDYHAVQGYNASGAISIIRRAVEHVSSADDDGGDDDNEDLDILLVTDLRNPHGDQSDSRLGIAAAGYEFDVADHGSGKEDVLDLAEVDFDHYDVIIVASDYGGWLRQDELDILNDRADDILDFVNDGGGLIALAESGDRTADSAAVYTGTTTDRYKFLPFLVSEVRERQNEVGFTLTEFGESIGLTEEDINYNYSHAYFDELGGMKPVDLDAMGRCLSAASRRPMTRDGVVLEIAVDIKPTSCPNPIQANGGGVLRVAVLGTDALDVRNIDLGSVALLDVAPLKDAYEDVAAPHLKRNPELGRLDCNEYAADGYEDLVLHFDKDQVVEAMERLLRRPLEDDEDLLLTLTAKLVGAAGGNQIQGEDVVWIVK